MFEQVFRVRRRNGIPSRSATLQSASPPSPVRVVDFDHDLIDLRPVAIFDALDDV